jgi:hypothetical protein
VRQPLAEKTFPVVQTTAIWVRVKLPPLAARIVGGLQAGRQMQRVRQDAGSGRGEVR